MKILHVVRNLDRYSGAAYQALNLARHQVSEGLDVTVLNISDVGKPCNYFNGNVNVITIQKNTSLTALLGILHRYRVVHFHGMFLKEILLAKLVRCKVLLKTTLLGEDDLDSIIKRPFGFVRIALLKWAVSVNNALSSPIEKINKAYFERSKITVIPNFVEQNEYVNNVSKDNVVVYVGAIVERKRVLDAIEFFEKNLQPSGYSMVVIGPSDIYESDADHKYVEQFKSKVKSNAGIQYLGKLEQTEVLRIFANSKALVFLSDKEGMPNVVLEALAANCFVITSSISGVASDIYEHCIQGFNIDNDSSFNASMLESSVEQNLPKILAEKKFYFSNNSQAYARVYQEMTIGK